MSSPEATEAIERAVDRVRSIAGARAHELFDLVGEVRFRDDYDYKVLEQACMIDSWAGLMIPMLTPKLTGIARGLRQSPDQAEVRLWARLRNRQLDDLEFRRQVPRGKFVADLLCDEAMLILEVDGSQHDEAPDKDAGRTAIWKLRRLGHAVSDLDVLQIQIVFAMHVRAVADERRTAPSSGPSGQLLPGEKGRCGLRLGWNAQQ